MNSKQLNRAMVQLGITQAALAAVLKCDVRTMRYYMRGEWPVPVTLALLINLMLTTNSKLEDLKS